MNKPIVTNYLFTNEADTDSNIQMPSDGVILPGGKSQLKKDGSGIKTDDDEGISVTPTPGFVLKTKDKGKSKVFVNVCYHDEIEPPGQKKKLDNDGNWKI